MLLNVRATNLGSMPSPTEIIFDALREAIVEGSLQDGETLRQDRIAAMFNVSRIPVREALARLEEQGLVTTQRHKGAVVSSLSLDEITDLFDFRALIEGEAIRLAVHRITPDTLDEARTHAAGFDGETDSSRWAQLNRLFHYALYRDCGRPYHLQTINKALDKIGRYLRAQLVLTDGVARARREHAGILQAAIDGDADRAADLTRMHILGASHSLVSFLRVQRGEG